MARPRRTPSVLETTRQCLAGPKSITPQPNLGPSFSVIHYGTEITVFDTRLGAYNQKLEALDDGQNNIDADETEPRDLKRRMLNEVETQFGPTAASTKAVVGARTSESPKPAAKAAGGTPSTPKITTIRVNGSARWGVA